MPVPQTLSAEEAALVEHAGQVARRAHQGQLDKAHLPYFESHVAEVHRRGVSYGGDVNEQIAALLHDVLEDTKVSETDLRNEGFPEEALVIVGLLTRDEGEPKGDYYGASAGTTPRVGSSCLVTSPATRTPPVWPCSRTSCG
jgi:(p)ppGpp synthase/HD superfamily hydrolase